jgi:hypothetical protein
LQEISLSDLFNVLRGLIGKSVMFIAEKKSSVSCFVEASFEIMRVSDNKSVIQYFSDLGVYKTQSKVKVDFCVK